MGSRNIYSDKGRPELGAERAFRILVLQFIEDLSDREMERYVCENNAAKRNGLPTIVFFGDFRNRLGTERLMDMFSLLRTSFKEAVLIREVLTFIDASP